MKQKLIRTALCLMLLIAVPAQEALASQEWPSDVSIEADAGIVMDADSGTVLYGKNIHDTYSPASITKVLTAVIVLENCDLDEMVTFSKNAVYNVEADSSSAGYDTGDTATVKDCLYALLLKSANESANALAEHVAGTTEAFAEMMNEKAKELGCVDSHFANPSGLNDENHYVSAYDMALITRYAFENETFREIASTTYYELPPNARNPEGLGVSPGNKMVKKNFAEYRPDVIGGKTGYTSIALNTLVIGAEQEDLRLITVVLHSHGTTYTDTSRMLDFGFENFRSVPLKDNDSTWERLSGSLTIAGLPTSAAPALTVDPDSRIVLPGSAEFDETTSSVSFDLPENAPDNALAAVHYSLGDHEVGTAWLTLGEAREENAPAIPEELLTAVPSTIAQADASAEDGGNADGADGSSSKDGDLGGSGALRTGGQDAGSDSKPAPDSQKNQNTDGTAGNSPEGSPQSSDPKESPGSGPLLPVPVLLALGAAAALAAVGAGGFIWLKNGRKREEAEQQERRRKRLERLKESGVSEDEFNELMKNRRLSIPLEPERRPARKKGKASSGSLLSKPPKRRSQGRGFSLRKKRWWKR